VKLCLGNEEKESRAYGVRETRGTGVGVRVMVSGDTHYIIVCARGYIIIISQLYEPRTKEIQGPPEHFKTPEQFE